MKKNIFWKALALVLCAPLTMSVGAADVKAGDIYGTDILAMVDGHPIPSYNIGGKTCICIEDLQYYGFDVVWDETTRCISATASERLPDYSVYANTARGKSGSVIGAIYETNIVAKVNGLMVDSYNIGGATCVCMEELGELAGSPNAAFGYSKYLMRASWDGEAKIISLDTFRPTAEARNPIITAGMEYGCYFTTNAPSGTVTMGYNSYYNDFRGTVKNIIPLYLVSRGATTDTVIAYASPVGVMFDEAVVAEVLAGNMTGSFTGTEALVRAAEDEAAFETIEKLDANGSVLLYGRYFYSRDNIIYSLRLFTEAGETVDLLADLPNIDAAEITFPVEDLKLSVGRTSVSFRLTCYGRTYSFEMDTETGELLFSH